MKNNTKNSNKRKIINDPVYGFIPINTEILFDIIEHPFYQRLRRIKQLGLSHLVYPGALHTRFHHSIGATHLMTKAIHSLQNKGVEITKEEETGVLIAILLHDIGHGPFSHTLEHSIVKGVDHEEISLLFMKELSNSFGKQLDLGIAIFENKYKKPFLHQLVSSQLDMDRMDYLNRDSFYTGVSEGVIGSDRIISMLNVKDNQLIVEQKGIYSIEKFIVARRLMYWQVYMHKTVVAADVLLTNILKRAKWLVKNHTEIKANPPLELFLRNEFSLADFKSNKDLLFQFALLDDIDIISAIKTWQFHSDPTLSLLSKKLINRRLLKIEIGTAPFSTKRINKEIERVMENDHLTKEEASYFIHTDELINNAYNEKKETINLWMKDGSVRDISIAADNLNIHALSEPVKKYFLCFPAH